MSKLFESLSDSLDDTEKEMIKNLFITNKFNDTLLKTSVKIKYDFFNYLHIDKLKDYKRTLVGSGVSSDVYKISKDDSSIIIEKKYKNASDKKAFFKELIISQFLSKQCNDCFMKTYVTDSTDCIYYNAYNNTRVLSRYDSPRLIKCVKLLHSFGMYHYDLKPENIYFDDDNKIVIGDYGLIKFKYNNTDECRQYDVTGSPKYMFPVFVYVSFYNILCKYPQLQDILAVALMIAGNYGHEITQYSPLEQKPKPASPSPANPFARNAKPTTLAAIAKSASNESSILIEDLKSNFRYKIIKSQHTDNIDIENKSIQIVDKFNLLYDSLYEKKESTDIILAIINLWTNILDEKKDGNRVISRKPSARNKKPQKPSARNKKPSARNKKPS